MGWSPFRKTGLTHHLASASVKGYTLVTPGGGDSAYLIDMAGRIVHRWRFPDVRPGYGRLLRNGNLLLRVVDPSAAPPDVRPGAVPTFEQNVRRLGGNATGLLEVDWEGKVVWNYDNIAIHHDFYRLDNGNTLVPEWVELPEAVAGKVRGGSRTRGEKLPPLLSDDIIEIDRQGKVVDRINVWKLLDPVRDPICPLERRLEWTHMNGLDLTSSGDIIFSCRTNSRIGIIARGSRELIWKYGAPNVHHQHHPTGLANGNIQIFDNGMHRVGLPRSRVVEVNPKDNATVWQYVADPEGGFFSPHISSAERLEGGNVLVCEGASGRVFEVTPRGELVWEWINPFANRDRGQLATAIFRAHRYAPHHPALAGRHLDAEKFAGLNSLNGLDG